MIQLVYRVISQHRGVRLRVRIWKKCFKNLAVNYCGKLTQTMLLLHGFSLKTVPISCSHPHLSLDVFIIDTWFNLTIAWQQIWIQDYWYLGQVCVAQLI